MTAPFKNFPFVFRLFFIMGMFIFNVAFFTYACFISIHFLFGVDYPEKLLLDGVINNGGDRNALLFVQGVTSFGGFVITAMMFSYLEAGEFTRHLRMDRYPKLKMAALAILAILLAQFFTDLLVQVNNKIPLPASLAFLKDAQQKAQALTDTLLDFKSFGKFLYVSVVLAVIPALGEEMFFRGLLLGDMLKVKIHPAVAIVISGLVFAIFHFEFQNTLAIWTLGCFLGYLYYISGSLWLPITVHFVNNFLEVLLKYMYNNKWITNDISNSSAPVYMTIISASIFVGCLFVFNKWRRPYVTGDELLHDGEIS